MSPAGLEGLSPYGFAHDHSLALVGPGSRWSWLSLVLALVGRAVSYTVFDLTKGCVFIVFRVRRSSGLRKFNNPELALPKAPFKPPVRRRRGGIWQGCGRGA